MSSPLMPPWAVGTVPLSPQKKSSLGPDTAQRNNCGSCLQSQGLISTKRHTKTNTHFKASSLEGVDVKAHGQGICIGSPGVALF